MNKNIYVKVEGGGIPVVLLHGWGVDHTMMEPIFEHLKKHYKVCMLDFPGFGNSMLERAYDVEDYVMFIKEIIDVYDLCNPVFIAHSFGCRVAFKYASKYPCRFLLLSGAAGIKPKRTYMYYLKVYTYKVLKRLGIKNSLGSEDYKNSTEILRNTLIKVVNEDISKDIEKIVVPILLIWGEKDEQTPLWMANRMKELNENVTLIVFENDDHYAYYHQMSRFLKICDYILKEVE